MFAFFMTGFYLTGFIFSLILIYGIILYNRLALNKSRVDEGWSVLYEKLKKRYEFIQVFLIQEPYINQTANEFYAGIERCITDGLHAITISEQVTIEAKLMKSFNQLLSKISCTPEGAGFKSMEKINTGLKALEGEIQAAANHYNATATYYNRCKDIFPESIISGLFGFKKREVFQYDWSC